MNTKSRRESVYNVSEKDFELILEATQQAEEFDLDRMKEAMKGKTYRIPRGLSKEEIRKYIMHMEYDNPFKNEDWNNPGKTILEAVTKARQQAKKVNKGMKDLIEGNDDE